ncbi:thioesterase [Motilibacter sp. E257]|uniref:Thioesterase n=2 Tax=Motilibacter deserti TaxID=2714956 RepID=A0ABX0H487_9ACTN|nr:thioesterase family protein [Motilibacter deserti]NHC16218.1 thioesterase [Motilibacter deserti]
MFLAEDAVLSAFRQAGLGPQRLFEEHGIGLEVVDTSTRLVGTLHVDDAVTGTVTPVANRHANGLSFAVHLSAEREGGPVPVLNGRLTVAPVTEKEGRGAPPPAELAAHLVPETTSAPGVAEPAAWAAPGGFEWQWNIPYYACHYYTRLQSNAYVRLLEETVDRYLEWAGLPITGLLATRDWIPVVSRARVQMIADAFMGETLHVTFTVDDVLKDTLFTGRMDCYVVRDGQRIHTATATIMHGYVMARGDNAFDEIITLDADTQAQLLGGRP